MILDRVDYIPEPYNSNGPQRLEPGAASRMLSQEEPITDGDGQFDNWPYQEPLRWGMQEDQRVRERSNHWGYPRGELVGCPVCMQLDVPKSGVYNAHNIPPIARALTAWYRQAQQMRCAPPPVGHLYCFTCHVVFGQMLIHEANQLIQLYDSIPLRTVDMCKPRIMAQHHDFSGTPAITREICGSVHGHAREVVLNLSSPSIILAAQHESMADAGISQWGHRSLLYQTYNRRQSNGFLSVRP